MERVTGIGGVFFRSPRPDELLAWYETHLGVERHPWGGSVFTSSGGETLTWAVFPAGTEYFGPSGQHAMVNYRVDDLDAMLAQLRAVGVEVDDRVEEQEYGRFGWAVDPDGNRFELWQPLAGN